MSKTQDPFAATSDPNLYVPRAATEAALEAMADATWHRDGVAALVGPSGLGKSLLLRVLARRAEQALHCIHVPVPTLDPEGITLWVASRLPGGRRVGGSDALLEVARERPLLLLIEDAELLPEDSARAVAELHRASDGAIRAVLAVNAEELPESLQAAFSPECRVVTLRAPMTRDEVVDYVTKRLAAAGVPLSVAERFDATAIGKLHELSAGNPARLNGAARAHMPAASRPLAPTLPDAGLWQDPFPLEPGPDPEVPVLSKASSQNRRRWVWGLSRVVAASAVTFGVGLLLGFWLREENPLSGSRLGQERGDRQSATSVRRPPTAEIEAPSRTEIPGAPERVRPEGAVAAGNVGTVAAIDRGRTNFRNEKLPRIETPPAVAAATPSTPPAISPRFDGGARGEVPGAVTSTPSSSAPGQTSALPPPPSHSRREIASTSPERSPLPSDRDREDSAEAAGIASPPRLALFAPELPRELTAELILSSDPPAVIEIDGQSFGATPIRIPGLRPGVHRLVAHFRTGETMAREVTLSTGARELNLRGPLRRAPRPGAPSSGENTRAETSPPGVFEANGVPALPGATAPSAPDTP